MYNFPYRVTAKQFVRGQWIVVDSDCYQTQEAASRRAAYLRAYRYAVRIERID